MTNSMLGALVARRPHADRVREPGVVRTQLIYW